MERSRNEEEGKYMMCRIRRGRERWMSERGRESETEIKGLKGDKAAGGVKAK